MAGKLFVMQASWPVQVQWEKWEAVVAVERCQAGRGGKCESVGRQGTVGQPLPWQQQGEEGKVPAVSCLWTDEPVAVAMVCALQLL